MRVLSRVLDAYTREYGALDVDASFARRRETRGLERAVRKGCPEPALGQQAGTHQPALLSMVQAAEDSVGPRRAVPTDAEWMSGEVPRAGAG